MRSGQTVIATMPHMMTSLESNVKLWVNQRTVAHAGKRTDQHDRPTFST